MNILQRVRNLYILSGIDMTKAPAQHKVAEVLSNAFPQSKRMATIVGPDPLAVFPEEKI